MPGTRIADISMQSGTIFAAHEDRFADARQARRDAARIEPTQGK
jgi:hypothetical protein